MNFVLPLYNFVNLARTKTAYCFNQRHVFFKSIFRSHVFHADRDLRTVSPIFGLIDDLVRNNFDIVHQNTIITVNADRMAFAVCKA